MSKNKSGFITLAIMALLVWFMPSTKVDPWDLLNLKKISLMIFTLSFIQIMSLALSRVLSVRSNALLTGFFSGLISSTATTAALARKSKTSESPDCSHEILIFLSATAAMLIEGMLFVLSSDSGLHKLSILFFGPLLATGILAYFYSRNLTVDMTPAKEISFEIIPILKLTVFIVSILLVSKFLQNLFGQNGFLVLTFLVSLFEIHGSVIANIQLNENGIFSTDYLSGLLAISIFSSYISKLFLILTLGSRHLFKKTIQSTFFIFLSLLVSWMIGQQIA